MALTKKILGGAKKAGKFFTKELTEQQLKDASIYERVAGRKLNKRGVAALTVGAIGVSTVNSVADNGLGKFQKLGNVGVGENLDRLVSYDGSGFINNLSKVSQGDIGIETDIVQNAFNNVNQTGVSGDIVFALHNMREG